MTQSLKKIGRISFIGLLSLLAIGTLAFFIFRLPPSPLSPDKFRGVEIAHRGGYELGPENTLATIFRNLEVGVTAFEVDVQLSADGVPMLFHDSTLHRLTGHAGKVGDLSATELKALPILDAQGSPTGQHMASLEELLDTLGKVAPEALLELDLKFYADDEEALLASVLGLVRGHGAMDRVLFSSFDPRIIYRLRRMAPDAIAGYAHTPVSGMGKVMDFLLNLSLVPKFLGVAVIEPHMDLVDEEYVAYWTRRGLVINAWTANTAADKERLLGLGLSLTTNCPFSYCEDRAEDSWAVPSSPAAGQPEAPISAP